MDRLGRAMVDFAPHFQSQVRVHNQRRVRRSMQERQAQPPESMMAEAQS